MASETAIQSFSICLSVDSSLRLISMLHMESKVICKSHKIRYVGRPSQTEKFEKDNYTFMLKSSSTKLFPSFTSFFSLLESKSSNSLTNLDSEVMEKGSARRRRILLWLSWETHSKLFSPTASPMDFTYPLLNWTKSLANIVFAPSELGTKTWIFPNSLVLNHLPCLV